MVITTLKQPCLYITYNITVTYTYYLLMDIGIDEYMHNDCEWCILLPIIVGVSLQFEVLIKHLSYTAYENSISAHGPCCLK